MSAGKFGTGRIGEIIRFLKKEYQVNTIREIGAPEKLKALCSALQLTPAQLDFLIAHNSPVLRTVKGHTFETAFSYLLTTRGHEVSTVGGDRSVDLVVNGRTLQLKTPYKAGTKGKIVSFKTHKTHGAKSELESMEYYHDVRSFPEFLVGLVSYAPLRILLLTQDELPRHPLDGDRILSPFSVDWSQHQALNAFSRIGIDGVDESSYADLIPETDGELLPISARELRLRTEIILNTILSEPNFRVWDMSIRGFAREVYFNDWLDAHGIARFEPSECRDERALKADLALKDAISGECRLFQVKGLSVNNCRFDGEESVVAVETQLTRGRVNDHPTQSRLYLFTDFDYLMIGIDPSIAQMYNAEIGVSTELRWELYVIPTGDLAPHKRYGHRVNAIQRFNYLALQKYRIDEDWLSLWARK